MPPLRLTDSELGAVFDAARPLPVECRDAFLQEVAEQLQHCNGNVGPGDVFRAIKAAQRMHFDPPDLRGAPGHGKYE